ncbi:hypothetical protein BH09BAC4_BH09BAC4_00650 [soil metagenome]
MVENENITIRLSKDEALILFDFLSRLNEKENKEFFDDQAEEKTLWVIEGQLQEILIEPFMPNYKDFIIEARNRLRDEE